MSIPWPCWHCWALLTRTLVELSLRQREPRSVVVRRQCSQERSIWAQIRGP